MISFSCSCGKKYQLPDRIGGREVRCNQCEKTLLVPKQSQDEPVVPIDDPVEQPSPRNDEPDVESPEKSEVVQKIEESKKEMESAPDSPRTPVGSSKAESKKTEQSKPTDSSKHQPSSGQWGTAVPVPTSTEEGDSAVNAVWAANNVSAAREIRWIWILMLLALVGIATSVCGFILGQMVAGGGHSSRSLLEDEEESAGSSAEIMDRHAANITASTQATQNQIKEHLLKGAAEAAEATREPDAAKRLDALKRLAESQQKDRADYENMLREEQLAQFLQKLAADFEKNDPGAEVQSALTLDPKFFDIMKNPERNSIHWSITEKAPLDFSARTADGAPILLSLDSNPSETKSEGKAAILNDLALTLNENSSPKDTAQHTVSLRIDSGSSRELLVSWPGIGSVPVGDKTIRQIKFSIYLSEKANAVFKPGKPEGIDKTLEFARFSLRIRSGSGFVEFVPANKELISLCEKARLAWHTVQIPIDGNDNWKRIDHGLLGSLHVDGIEFHAQPTGSGITFWIDNLKIDD